MPKSLRCAVCATALTAAVMLAVGCDSSSSMTTAPGADSVAVARTQAVAHINQLRATLALPALTEWTAGESCADGQAQADNAAGTTHSAFGTCGEFAQDECPDWPALSQVVAGCMQTFWNEGPGSDFTTHGDYTNMASTTYTKVAVGIYLTPSHTVWAVINFGH
jgi:hypothetical protein